MGNHHAALVSSILKNRKVRSWWARSTHRLVSAVPSYSGEGCAADSYLHLTILDLKRSHKRFHPRDQRSDELPERLNPPFSRK
jgi:hypothetical protein